MIPPVIAAVSVNLGLVYILVRLFLMVLLFNLAWSLFMAFLVTYVGGLWDGGAGGGGFKALWAMVQPLVNMMTYLKVNRCIALIVTTISVKIMRKYILDKAYDAILG